MIRRPITTKWKVICGVFSVTGLIFFYSHFLSDPTNSTLPTLNQMYDALKKVCTPQGSIQKEVWLWTDFIATYKRLFFGLSVGCFLSVIFGILMGCYPAIESFFVPPFSFLAKVPPTAMLAVFFVLVGSGMEMFVSMIAFGVIPTLAMAIYLSAKHDVHHEHVNKAYTLGASNCEVIWNVVTRQILPKIIETTRLQIGPAMVYLIAAEYMMSQVGFGYRLRIQSRLLHMDVVYLYLIILGTTGFLIDLGMVRFRKWLCPWYSLGS